MLKFVCLALFVACASAASTIQGSLSRIEEIYGVVPHTICSGNPGNGVAHELSISGCSGPGCIVVPGSDTTFTGVFTSSIAAENGQFSAWAIVGDNSWLPVAEGDLGPIQPNQRYGVSQVIRVSDALVGMSPTIRIEVSDGARRIFCIETIVTIQNRP